MHQGAGEQLSGVTAASDTCASCGAVSTGEFCSVCGERRAGAHDLSVRRVAGDLVEAVTTLDSRAYRSFRRLVTRPGFLTAELAAGRRQRYLAPIHLFVLVNLVYFLIASQALVLSAAWLIFLGLYRNLVYVTALYSV